MKTSILNTILTVAIIALFASCSSDDGGNTVIAASCSDGIQNGNETGVDCGGSACEPCISGLSNILIGDVTTDVILDSTVAYELTGGYVIQSGGSLTIPAGTVITATGGTAAYIAVAVGGELFINGTAASPVVMTSGAANPAAGDWGGLVICGDAPTNKGVNVTSEVADLIYGGTDLTDSSGSIEYLRVEYTGATFSNDKEFNGVSLFGVGSGTTFNYVQSLNGGDDGIEFFGGTVSGNYLVSIGSGDDSIDFADGWNGNGSNWYIKGGAKAGIEGSNNGDNGNATPVTTTTLSNISVVGPVSEGALYFKEGGGNFTITNFYTDAVNLGVRVKDTDAEAAVRIEAGLLSLNPMQFDNPTAGWEITNYTGANQNFITVGPTSGAGNGAGAPSWASGWTSGL
tara:strand:- start:1340 stop:2539 length:1200 start_codon:yes stop_codon:yes gene_type:complete